jgi:hypothetical protein
VSQSTYLDVVQVCLHVLVPVQPGRPPIGPPPSELAPPLWPATPPVPSIAVGGAPPAREPPELVPPEYIAPPIPPAPPENDVAPPTPPAPPVKMTARLQAATSSGRPVFLLYDTKAGHGDGVRRTDTNFESAEAAAPETTLPPSRACLRWEG